MTGIYRFELYRRVKWLPFLVQYFAGNTKESKTWAEAYDLFVKTASLPRVERIVVARPDNTVVVFGKGGKRIV